MTQQSSFSVPRETVGDERRFVVPSAADRCSLLAIIVWLTGTDKNGVKELLRYYHTTVPNYL
jgi:hypothetical protein